MEINVKILCWILSIVVFGIIMLVIYTWKRKTTQEDLEIFLDMIYVTFLDIKKKQLELHKEDQVTKATIAQTIKDSIKDDFEHEFKSLLLALHLFPPKSFRFSSEDPEANAFFSKIFPTIKIAYKEYGYTKSSSQRLSLKVFNRIEKIALQELEKDTNPHT